VPVINNKPLQIEVGSTLDKIDSADWNALSHGDNPFVRYEFLSALETNKCVDPKYGWHPYHLLVKDDDGKLIAAAPRLLPQINLCSSVYTGDRPSVTGA